VLRRMRIGRWKAAVSAKQRARKKRYCSIIGWEARKGEAGVGDWVVVLWFVGVCVVLLIAACDDGVDEVGEIAFSMRAQVR